MIVMAIVPDSIPEIERLCRSSGFDFVQLHKVCDRLYQGTLRDSPFSNTSTAFLKFYSPSSQETLQEFVNNIVNMGYPECYLIDEEYLALLIEPACGRPLSHLLPIVFLPGVWRFRKQRYERAFFHLGKQLGLLHAATIRDCGPVLSEQRREKALDHARSVEDQLPNTVVSKIQSLLSMELQTPHVLTVGDRSPHNIYFDGSTVSQIDFSPRPLSIAYEHASVLVGLRLMNRRLPYATSKKSYNLEQSYWKGYKKAKIDLPEKQALVVWYVCLYLHLLNFYNSGPESLNAKLTKWVDPPKIRTEIRRTVEKTP